LPANISAYNTNWGILPKDSIEVKLFHIINPSNITDSKIEILKLKNNDQGFHITDINGGNFSLPVTLKPMDSIPFLVWYRSESNCKSLDSIGLGNSCVFAYRKQIEASPVKLSIIPKSTNFGNFGNIISTKTLWIVNDSYTSVFLPDGFKLKNNSKEFQITDVNGKEFIAPMTVREKSAIPFKINFSAKKIGVYADSIGLGDSCNFEYLSYLHADVNYLDVYDETNESNTLHISPNPSDGNAIIEFNPVENASLMLYNELGIGFEIPIVAGINRVNLKTYELASGVYHLVMRAGAEIVVRKLLIQR
jgi:hypothetical protein